MSDMIPGTGPRRVPMRDLMIEALRRASGTSGGWVATNAIAESIGARPTSIGSGLGDRMVEEGILEKRRSPSDGLQYEWRLIDAKADHRRHREIGHETAMIARARQAIDRSGGWISVDDICQRIGCDDPMRRRNLRSALVHDVFRGRLERRRLTRGSNSRLILEYRTARAQGDPSPSRGGGTQMSGSTRITCAECLSRSAPFVGKNGLPICARCLKARIKERKGLTKGGW